MDVSNARDTNHIIPVLLYHSISDDRSRNDRFAVSPAVFATHVEAIAASGRTSITIGELARALRGDKALPPQVVAITFDDGFADNYNALLTLLDHRLRSTLYITTGPLGTGDRLTRSQVAEIARMPGVEVGAHTVRHQYLDELDDPRISEEVRVCKHELEDLVQRRVRSFAYPHGAYDERVRQAVINAGYESAAAVKNAVSHLGDDPFAVARWTVNAGTSAFRIAEVLEGRHVPLAWSRERLRTRAYRTARRVQRRVSKILPTSRTSAGGVGAVGAS